MSDGPIVLQLELSAEQAWDLAQLVKRLTFSDVRGCAADQDEAYRMVEALEVVRAALAQQGVAPR